MNSRNSKKTIRRFGYEWSTYYEILPEYELQFKKWVAPLTPADFKGQRVLDAGCGMGRNSFWALKWGAREVVAFDAERRTIKAASRNLAQFPNARVLLKSIYDISWQSEFDIAFSIGVIHHLESPALALRKLVDSVKPGGRVLIWVYGYENNEWIVKFISPLRRLLTSRLPPAVLNFLTYAISTPFFIFIKVVPVGNTYLRQIKRFRFRHVHSIIFDQLLPRIANYYTRFDAEELLNRAGLGDVVANHTNDNSWTVIGTKKPLG